MAKPQPQILIKKHNRKQQNAPEKPDGKVAVFHFPAIPEFIAKRLFKMLAAASFIIVLFFALTGLTLNHPEWFADQEKTSRHKGFMPPEWLNDPDTAKIEKLHVVEFLREKHSIKGPLEDFVADDSECSLTFKGPGYAADAFIVRETGEYDLSETHMGTVAFMNDIHRGYDTGIWPAVLDLLALFLSVISLSGLILILFMKGGRYRDSGKEI